MSRFYSVREVPAKGIPNYLMPVISTRGWFLFLVCYFGLHFILRVTLSSSLQIDAAEQIVQAQSLRWNYGNFQPPLFTWLLSLVWKVIPVSLESFVGFRYVILFVTFWIWRLIALQIFKDPGRQLLAATSWLLVFDFAWKLHQGSTHTTLMMLALVMTLHAVLLIMNNGKSRNYLYLGFAMALGVSSKYSYAGYVLATLLSGLLIAEVRSFILNKRILVTLISGVIFSTPAMISLLIPNETVVEGLNGELLFTPGGLISGNPGLLVLFLNACMEFTVLTLVIYALASIKRVSVGGNDLLIKWWFIFFLVVFATFLLAAVFFDASIIKARWMHPFLWFFPFFALMFMMSKSSAVQGGVIVFSTIVLMVLVVYARIYQMTYISGEADKPGRLKWPVMDVVRQIDDNLFVDTNVYAKDAYLAAHIILAKKVNVSLGPPVGKKVVFFKGEVLTNKASSSIENTNSIEKFKKNIGYKVSWYRDDL